MFNAGDVIGPYALVRKLGEGSFGVVWLAESADGRTQGQFALKTLKCPDANAILQEVFNWAKADGHPNVLPIVEAGVYQTPRGEVPIIVSSYVREGSLRDWAGQHRPLAADTAVEMACGILDGLEHLHRRRIIHRDLKPENVLICQGAPLLTDFGIARFQQSDADVQSFTVAGTVPYMAPEAFRGVRSPQTDVWSAAVICYELLAGRRPFPPDMGLIVGPSPAPPLPQSVARPLRNVVEFTLRKDPALRHYKTAAELRDALLEAAGAVETRVRPAAEAARPAEPDDSRPVTPPGEEPSPARAADAPQKVLDVKVERMLKARNATIVNRKTRRGEPGTDPRGDAHTRMSVGDIEVEGDFRLTNEEEV